MEPGEGRERETNVIPSHFLPNKTELPAEYETR